MTKPEHTHEKDQELWSKALHGALSAKLKPGQILTQEERDWALEEIRLNEEADERDRYQ